MRIWHEDLVPHLCRQHLLAVWREGLGCYNVVTSDKQGYRNHPATKEWLHAPLALWNYLRLVRREMLERGYNPKPMPPKPPYTPSEYRKEWQTREEQIDVLKTKGCDCKIHNL